MPFLNAEPFLREAIESVLDQQFRGDLELLLVDDGSQDGSLRVALELAAAAPERIRILRHPGGQNRGASASRNLALRHACGELLTFLDADDLWLPGALQSQLDTLAHFPAAAMVYGAAERWCMHDAPFDEAGARTSWWGSNYIPPSLPEHQPFGLLPDGALLEWFLADEALVPCICSVLLRTAAARAAGGFEEQFRGLYDDQAFHAKIALQYSVAAHPACLARYRQHGTSCCATGRGNANLQQAERGRFLRWLAQYRRSLLANHTQATAQPQA